MPEIIDQVLVHQSIVDRFEQLANRDRLAHAYLFVGPHGIGKMQTALSVAQYFLSQESQEEGLGFQMPVSNVNPLSHPDVHILSLQESSKIKIEQVRELLGHIRLKPLLARRKICILQNIENLSIEGANALLKTLEEPPPNCLMLLSTVMMDSNLSTIRSRCQTIHFPLKTVDEIRQFIVAEHKINKEQAHFISHMAGGCLGQAVDLIEDDVASIKNDWINLFLFTSDAEPFIKEITSDKEVLKLFLEILAAWMRDCMLVKSSISDERLVHFDRLDELMKFSAKFEFEKLNDIYRHVVGAQKQLAENLNIKIPLLIIKELTWVN